MAPANHEARRATAAAEYQNLLEEGQAIIEVYELYAPWLTFVTILDLYESQERYMTS